MAREAEIWQELVYLVDCPHCEARNVFDQDPRTAEVHHLDCIACKKPFDGIYPEETE